MTTDDFPDTIIAHRRNQSDIDDDFVFRYNKPMDLRPAIYEAAHAASELDDDDSEFGALEGLTHGMPYVVVAWGIIAATAVAAYLIWW